jgi:phospholipid/cholesterol/gamma-HCH transport system substrate-binding protein
MRPRRLPEVGRSFRATGAVVTALVLVVVYVAFNANRRLPFEHTYQVTVALPSADRLAETNEVRIAGVRVGQVKDVAAIRGSAGRPPTARATLKLEQSVGALPVDSIVKIRPASILGTSYVDLTLGTSATTIPAGGSLPLARARRTVDLTDLLDTFDRSTARSAQATLSSLGDSLAGRGPSLNRGLAGLARLLPPLQRVTRTLAAPSTRLAAWVDGYTGFIRGLEPVAPQLSSLLQGGSTTFAAVAGENQALGAAIRAAAPAERATTAGLTRLQPSLDGLAEVFTGLRPSVARLPRALREANGAVSAGTPALRSVPQLTAPLDLTLRELGRRSREPATSGSLRKLGDMATAAQVTLDKLVPAQVQCNVISLFAQSFGTAYGSVGFKEGPPMAFIGEKHLGSVGESLQAAAPVSGLAVNVNPNENYDECESGNEPYPYGSIPVFNGQGKPLLGNPPGLQDNQTLDTYPPPGVHELARGINLLPLLKEEK